MRSINAQVPQNKTKQTNKKWWENFFETNQLWKQTNDVINENELNEFIEKNNS